MTIQFLRYIVSVAEIGLGMAVDINTLYNPYRAGNRRSLSGQDAGLRLQDRKR